jgi:predicted NAD-dependent protein-ADP-ribosyltransferase YbiA (DUF1768 family)
MICLTPQRYQKRACAVFSKTRRAWGKLTNMHDDFPLLWADKTILGGSEALYHALRFTEHPALQQYVLDAPTPMQSKTRAYEHLEKTRDDWLLGGNVQAMHWCLEQKTAQYFDTLLAVMLASQDKPFVEYSSRDPFWGASKVAEGEIEGVNALGQLWDRTRLRILGHALKHPDSPFEPMALALPEPFLLEHAIS